MSSTRTFLADDASDGMRVDSFLAGRLNVSAGRARRLCLEGKVRIDGSRVAKGARVARGVFVEVDEVGLGKHEGDEAEDQSGGDAALTSIVADPMVPIALLHEDPHLIAIDKPAGIPSHPLRPDERGTAANGIVARFPECLRASPVPREGGLGHRLDTGTSGVLIAARTRAAWEGLRRALGDQSCEKEYLAEVLGHPPREGRVDAAIGRVGRRGSAVRVGGGRNPQAAETRWAVVEQGRETALVLARLHRGRTHQVRAHLAAAGFPLVGDDRYGPSEPRGQVGFRLHALGVRLIHPITREELSIRAPRPAWALSGKLG